MAVSNILQCCFPLLFYAGILIVHFYRITSSLSVLWCHRVESSGKNYFLIEKELQCKML